MTKPLVRCPVYKVKLAGTDGQPLKAHMMPKEVRKWCSGGAEPSAADLRRQQRTLGINTRPQSVRTIFGGLPTLGKRR